jgi:hypothetical protein
MVDILPYKEISLLPNRMIKTYKSRVADPDYSGTVKAQNGGVEVQNGAVKDL